MAIPVFTKQGDRPLFPDVFWNRPTMRQRAGRLLLVGGHRGEFSLLQAIYHSAEAAGIGECIAAMPDSLRRSVGEAPFGRFVPASASGSLGKGALGALLQLGSDADALVIGANLTNNAETAVIIESLITKLEQPVVITEETIGILQFHPELITGNPRALVVTTMPGLFALAGHHHMPIAIKPGGGVVGKIEILQQLASISRCSYLVFDSELLVQAESKTSLTPLSQPLSTLPGAVIGIAATFWIQHQVQSYQALSAAAFVLAQATTAAPTTYAAITKQVQETLSQLST
jgi:NAD(P)H-hydrate repair Nnr-like enzyme with NAD(P)H-hydrate dehydratase domain